MQSPGENSSLGVAPSSSVPQPFFVQTICSVDCVCRHGWPALPAVLCAREQAPNCLPLRMTTCYRAKYQLACGKTLQALKEIHHPAGNRTYTFLVQGCELQALPARPERGGIVPCRLQLSTQTVTLALALANLLDANIGCKASRTITKSQAAGRDFWLTSSSLRLIIDELLQLQGFCAHDLNLERRV